MNQISFIHCHNLNFGYSIKVADYKSAKKLNIRREDLKTVLNNIIDSAIYEKADIILFSGIFADVKNADDSTKEYIIDRFKANDLKAMRIVIMPYDDAYLTDSLYSRLKEIENILVLETEKFSFESKNTTFYRLDESNMDTFSENLNEIRTGDSFNIVLSSIPVKSSIPTEQNPCFHADDMNALDVSSNKSDVLGHESDPGKPEHEQNVCPEPEQAGSYEYEDSVYNKDFLNEVDYIALGCGDKRVHDIFGDGKVYCPGTPEPLVLHQTEPHGVYSVTLTKKSDGTTRKDIAFIEVSKRKNFAVDIDIAKCFSQDAISEKIIDTVTPDEENGYIINLSGEINPFLEYDLKEIEKEIENYYFDLILEDKDVRRYDIDTIIAEPGIKGLFTKKMVDRINAALSREKKSVLTKALSFGIQALDDKEINI